MGFIARHRILVGLAAFAIVLATYIAGYFLRGQRFCGFRDFETKTLACGSGYFHDWEATLFIPAAAVESFVMDQNRVIITKDGVFWRSTLRQPTSVEDMAMYFEKPPA